MQTGVTVGGSGSLEGTDRNTGAPVATPSVASPGRDHVAPLAVVRAQPAWTPDMPIFMSPAWLRGQSADVGWLEARPAPDVHLVVPFVGRHKAGLRWVQFQWGVWSSSPIDTTLERAFLDGVTVACRAEGYHFITQPATMALFRTAPTGAAAAPFGTVVIELTDAEDVLWAAVRSRNRSAIRKAQASGVTVEWGAHLAEVAHMLCAGTMARSGLSFPTLPQFRELAASLGDAVDIGVAYADGAPKACVVNPWSRFGAHCLFAGTADAPTPGAANLLQWEAMLRAKQHGARVYDFVGVRLDPDPDSKYAGLYQFKTRFGGEVVEGCLWKMPLSGWRYRLYGILKRVRGDAPDIIDQVGGAR